MAVKLLLGTVYPHDETQVCGGVEAIAVNLVHALQKRNDVELHVVSFSPWVKKFHKEKRGHTTFYWLPTFYFLYGVRAMTVDGWRFYYLCRKIKPDIIHAQNVSEYATWIPSGIPMVLTIHGVELFEPEMLNTRHFQGFVGMYRKWIGRQIFKRSTKNANGVISIAGEYIPKVMGGMLDKKPIYMIPNPIREFWFDLPQETNVDPGPFVLYVGNIIEGKNALGLVQAFSKVKSKFPRAILGFAGAIRDQIYYKKVLDTIRNLNLQENVQFLGHLTDEKLKQRYAQASIVVLPSIQETAPMALMQAMAIGKPVVATQVGGVSSMIEHGVTGFLVPSHDMDAFSSYIIQLLANQELRRWIGKRAHQFARQNFSADKVAEKTVKVYQEILKKNKDVHQELSV